jgi:hypothetical protein
MSIVYAVTATTYTIYFQSFLQGSPYTGAPNPGLGLATEGVSHVTAATTWGDSSIACRGSLERFVLTRWVARNRRDAIRDCRFNLHDFGDLQRVVLLTEAYRVMKT